MCRSGRTAMLFLLLTLLMLLPATISYADSGPDPGFGRKVAGTFLVNLELIGTDGSPLSLQAMATLTADGAAIATDTDDYGFGTGSFFHSPKQGVWKKTGRRAVSITLLEFAYGAEGFLTTAYKLNFRGKFADRDFRSGGGSVVFDAYLPGQDPLDPEEIPVANGEGTFAVRRVTP